MGLPEIRYTDLRDAVPPASRPAKPRWSTLSSEYDKPAGTLICIMTRQFRVAASRSVPGPAAATNEEKTEVATWLSGESAVVAVPSQPVPAYSTLSMNPASVVVAGASTRSVDPAGPAGGGPLALRAAAPGGTVARRPALVLAGVLGAGAGAQSGDALAVAGAEHLPRDAGAAGFTGVGRRVRCDGAVGGRRVRCHGRVGGGP